MDPEFLAAVSANIIHFWVSSSGFKWGMIYFNVRPYLACEEDA